MKSEPLPNVENFLREKLKNEPSNWETRRRLAHALYDKGDFEEAANVVWEADQIPSTDLELAFAARVLAKAQPRKAIRLLTAVLEQNRGKAVQNMGMANALLHHGMVLQAARFYGAALEVDPTLANPDLEHFVLWTDDECAVWGDFKDRRPRLGELPWMVRDPKEALRLTSRINLHTTPIHVPSLAAVAGEEIRQQLYQQEAKRNAKITPPPAVTIPVDRVHPKDRVFDETYGAQVTKEENPPASVPESSPQKARVLKVGAPVSIQPQAAPVAPPAALTPTVVPTRHMATAMPPAAIPTTSSAPPAIPVPKTLPPQQPAFKPPVLPPRPTVSLPAKTAAPAPTRRLITPALQPKGSPTVPLKPKPNGSN